MKNKKSMTKNICVLTFALCAAGLLQQGCLESPTDSSASPVIGTWSFATGSEVKSGIIFHYSSLKATTQAETTMVNNSLVGTTLTFTTGDKVTANIPFFSSALKLDGTWSYTPTDSMLSMTISGTTLWATKKTGKLSLNGKTATIRYVLPPDTLMHGSSTSGTITNNVSDVFVGTDIVTMSK